MIALNNAKFIGLIIVSVFAFEASVKAGVRDCRLSNPSVRPGKSVLPDASLNADSSCESYLRNQRIRVLFVIRPHSFNS